MNNIGSAPMKISKEMLRMIRSMHPDRFPLDENGQYVSPKRRPELYADVIAELEREREEKLSSIISEEE